MSDKATGRRNTRYTRYIKREVNTPTIGGAVETDRERGHDESIDAGTKSLNRTKCSRCDACVHREVILVLWGTPHKKYCVVHMSRCRSSCVMPPSKLQLSDQHSAETRTREV